MTEVDIVAVVTRVVQAQQKTIQSQGKEIQGLKSLLQQTLAGLSSVQEQVNHLQAAQGRPVLNPVGYAGTVH